MTDDHASLTSSNDALTPHELASVPERAWWKAQPVRDELATISAKRAYGEVLFVYSCFFLASISIAVASLFTHLGSSNYTWSQSISASINQVAVGALAVALPLLLSQRRGVSLADIGLSRDIVKQPAQGIRIAGWCFAGVIGGGIVISALSTRRFPFPHFSGANLMIDLFHALQAGPLEEIVVLGFVVTTLQQARRPIWEIVIVALVLRDAFHLYYGWGALGIFVWASLFLWLYLRFRTLWPLIIAHSIWDVAGTLGQYWKVAIGYELLGIILLWAAGFITWLIARSNAKAVVLVPRR